MLKHGMIVIWFALLPTVCRAAPQELVIFHTNDIHSRFLPERASWREDSAMVGGFAALSGYLDSLRKDNVRSIYLDAGDVMTGNPICNINYDGIDGGALLKFYDLLDLDAFELGNHEFDKGTEFARLFSRAAHFPVLCSNLVEKGKPEPAFKPFVILERDGLKIGVIGLILEGFVDIVTKSSSESFDVLKAAETAQSYIDELDPRTDLIILLTHIGIEDDRKLAQQLHNVDLIIGGHSHTRLDEPGKVNGIVIAQAGSYCKNLGILRLTVAGDTLMNYSGKLIPLIVKDVRPNPVVAALSDSLDSVIKSIYGEVINSTPVPLKREYSQSCNLGNLLCDLMRARYRTDIAFANSGGIRMDLNPGSITKLDVVEMLPFQNGVVVFEATGAELMNTVRQQARAQGIESGEILQMSGLEVKYRSANSDIEIEEVRVGEEPLDESQIYSVVTHDYISNSHPEQYLKFEPRSVQQTGELFPDVIIEELSKCTNPIQADSRSRLEKLDER
jgi:2',3'-cyclic-nucleotide 2'-phosphodiesterase (5'-nucleotidase family)